MAAARTQHTATLLADGQVLVTGGNANFHLGLCCLSSAELYDSPTGFFSSAGTRARQAFVWTLENCDLVRHGEPFEYRAIRQRPTLVQAEQAGPRWFLLDDDRNVFHAPTEAPRNAAQRVLDQEFEVGKG